MGTDGQQLPFLLDESALTRLDHQVKPFLRLLESLPGQSLRLKSVVLLRLQYARHLTAEEHKIGGSRIIQSQLHVQIIWLRSVESRIYSPFIQISSVTIIDQVADHAPAVLALQ